MSEVILGAWLLAWHCIFAGPNVANIGLTQDVLLVVTVCDDSADDQVLVRGPVRQGNDGRIPEHSGFGLRGAWWDLRNVVDSIR